MATKVRKVSTSKLDDLFAQESWAESRSGPPSSSSIKKNFPTMGSFVDMRPPSIKLPQNCSVLAPSGSSSSSFSSAETDDEYGYYDDFNEEPTVTPSVDDANHSSSISRKCSSKSNASTAGIAFTPYSSAKSLSYSPMALRSLGMSRSASSVLCLIEDHKADLTCRSFETFTANSNINVCISMAGIRIIQRDFSEIAEYKLRIIIDDQEFIAWKSFNDFKSLGEACRVHMKQSRGRRHSLRNTVHAWDDVLSHRSWWKRPTQIEFMMEESNLLEDFMKNLLFEIPCIEMLVEFAVS